MKFCTMNHKVQNIKYTRVLKNFIVCLGLDFGDCRGQRYDGAQIFQGHVKGVGKRFKDNSVATSVHCLAYTALISDFRKLKMQ